MGDVYRARDTQLGRDVALKVLPDAFTQDPDRLARFKREAQVLASLNHPHIAAIYAVQDSGTTHSLILELVDGETLASRLRRGALPLDEAIQFAREIADALQAAHEHGIVHRDLKPANIALTATDEIKVLDFGLAKAGDTLGSSVSPPGMAGEADRPGLVHSPTVTVTEPGMLIGTAAHMSPEQAKGRAADKRSDIWAFGTVFYEMLTGVQAFEGEDVLETLTSVMRDEPDWRRLPASTPSHIRGLLDRCLKKDRKQRISDMAVVQFLLDAPAELAATVGSTRSMPPATPLWRRVSMPIALVAAGFALGAAVWQFRTPTAPPRQVTRFTLSLGPGEQFTGLDHQALAISPDGTRIVYSANNRLHLRSLSDGTSTVISGADFVGGVWAPVFSPDSRSIAFAVPGDHSIKRIEVGGGSLLTLCSGDPCANGYLSGLSWGADGVVFGNPNFGGAIVVGRVSANGGPADTLIGFLPRSDAVAARRSGTLDG